MLAIRNCKTKKQLKEMKGCTLQDQETSMFGTEYVSTGKFCIVGHSAYERKWFAEVEMKDDIIVGVK